MARDIKWDSRRSSIVTQTARSGKNKFTAAREQGGNSYSATGRTRGEAYRNLRKGMGQSGG